MTPRLPRPLRLALAFALLCAAPLAALSQDLFSPAIVVNDSAVTGWEIEQRARLLTLFGTPGDTMAAARTELVDDRLKAQELDRVGGSLTDEGLARAIEDFASRAGQTTDEFVATLASSGIEYETLRDYVSVNTTWRDYVRARFSDRVTVTAAEVDQRLAQASTQAAGIEVLLSEIIIPAPPPEAAQAQAVAEGLSRITSVPEFEAAAREVSAVPSREQGGRLDWAPLSNYPPALQELLLGLAPGEVTPPLSLTGAVALLQLRDLREGPVAAASPETVDYALLRIPGGLSAPALAEAARVAANVDTCDDLYGVAQGLPGSLTREAVAPAALPAEVALDVARLDPNEATWGQTTDGGATLLFTMLCARTFPLPEGAGDRAAVEAAIFGERLTTYADAIVADLRAAATIVGE